MDARSIILNMPRICVLLALLALTGVLTACAFDSKARSIEEEKIQDRLEAFLTAYSNRDWNGMLASVDAHARRRYEALCNRVAEIRLGGDGFGFDASGRLDCGALFGFSAGAIPVGQRLRVEILSMALAGEETAYVHTAMTHRTKSAEIAQGIRWTLVKENGDWFVGDMARSV